MLVPRPLTCALLVAAALGLASCGNGGDGEGTDGAATTASPETTAADTAGASPAQACRDVTAPEPKDTELSEPEQVLERGQRATVEVKTSCGSFTIRLATDEAPETANSFAYLVQEGFYDDTVFHRIVPGFVIQGGDPQGSGDQPGAGGPGYSVTEEPPDDVRYTEGVVAMAKAGDEPPGTSGSQFFVVVGEETGLPPEFALLGEIAEGERVVEAIGQLGDPSTEQPTQTVVVEEMSLDVAGG